MKRLSIAALLSTLAPLLLLAQTPRQQDQAEPNTAMHSEKPPVPPSKSLTVSFQGKTIVFSVADLLNLPQVTVHVHNVHRDRDETYTGPLVSDVLARAGFTASKETEPLILHSAVMATATDHYFVLYSAAEMEPSFSNGKVIVALMKEGLPDTQGGNIQLVNTDGAKPARWVHGLTTLSVMSMVPSH